MTRKAKIFSVVNQKGGVGKTTTTINLATAIASSRNKVLIIDIDPQGNASTGIGVAYNQRQKTIYEVLIGNCKVNDAIMPTKIKGLDVITATVDLSALEIEFADVKDKNYILKNKIEEISSEYDYIFIDCPPSLGVLTINTLTASDYVLIPMQCEFFSLEGLSHLLTTLELVKNNLNPTLKIAGIILTMHDRRNKLTEAVEIDVRNYLEDKVFKNIVPRNVKLSEAPSYGEPALTYDPECRGSIAYKMLAKEILARNF